ncbi:MAG: outer membrane lipoprotein-sorting protein [Verrucomicrobiota bacterium]|nr:outer membrane lipoprotein-sorting protein [Verrucomicrobiota bacterium]
MKLKAPFRFLLAVCLTSASAAAPPAKQILAQVRMQQAQQDIDLQGQLREQSSGRVVPFRLTLNGPVVRYTFTNPSEALQLRLGDNDSQLEQVGKNGIDKIAGPEFEQKVRDTDVTYEDLALRFLYWPAAEVVGEDYINTRRVWKLELKPPGHQSQYSRVLLWCDEKSGAMMKVEAFDWNGKLAKRFTIVSVQDIEGRTFLKQMRIDNLQPGKAPSYTYLEIKK